MNVEEEFEIVISNDSTATIDTLGDLTDLIVELLRAEGRPLPRPVVRARIVTIVRQFVGEQGLLDDSVSFVRDLGLD